MAEHRTGGRETRWRHEMDKEQHLASWQAFVRLSLGAGAATAALLLILAWALV